MIAIFEVDGEKFIALSEPLAALIFVASLALAALAGALSRGRRQIKQYRSHLARLEAIEHEAREVAYENQQIYESTRAAMNDLAGQSWRNV